MFIATQSTVKMKIITHFPSAGVALDAFGWTQSAQNTIKRPVFPHVRFATMLYLNICFVQVVNSPFTGLNTQRHFRFAVCVAKRQKWDAVQLVIIKCTNTMSRRVTRAASVLQCDSHRSHKYPCIHCGHRGPYCPDCSECRYCSGPAPGDYQCVYCASYCRGGASDVCSICKAFPVCIECIDTCNCGQGHRVCNKGHYCFSCGDLVCNQTRIPDLLRSNWCGDCTPKLSPQLIRIAKQQIYNE